MKQYIIIVLALIFVVACGGKSGGGETSSSGVDGKKIFKSNCVLCHGEDGKLGLNNSKDLTVSKLTMDERKTIIKNGKNTMTGFGPLLSDEEIAAVAKYTFNIK